MLARPVPLVRQRPVSHPLLVPAWIVAACLLIWTLGGAVWFVRMERALGKAQDAVREMERREEAKAAVSEDDLTRRLREKYGAK